MNQIDPHPEATTKTTTKRRRFGLGAGVLVAVGVLVWLGLVLLPSEAGGKQRNAEQQRDVQGQIDAACADGGIVKLSGVYVTNETIVIEDCHGLTVEGPATLDGSAIPREREQRHLSIRRSEDIVVEGITVVGGRCERPCESPTTLTANERQHGFEIAASTDIELRDVAAINVWGDAVYITAKSFDKGQVTPTGIVVRDAYFSNSGRQGISASGVDGMLVERTVVRLANRSVFDFEAESGGVKNLTVRDSDVISPDNAVVNISCKMGGGTTILNEGPFLFSGNRVYDGEFSVNPHGSCVPPPGAVVLEDNVDGLALDDAPPPPKVPGDKGAGGR